MTREEAIDIIRNYDVNGCGYCHQGGNEVKEAFYMAIKALEQKPMFIVKSDGTIEQIKAIYNKGWKDGAEATAYHVELCEEENPTVPLSVIEEIKSDIAEFMSEIPTLGNCKEGWHNAGQRIGLEQACEIIDNHIAERGTE